MAKLRHLAILVPDPEASAKFFVEAFGLKRVGEARMAVYLSDGTVNVALLRIDRDDETTGLAHYGMWVDNLGAAEEQAIAAGATPLAAEPGENAFFERKYKDANGIVFDLSQKGWVGAEKDVVPAGAERRT